MQKWTWCTLVKHFLIITLILSKFQLVFQTEPGRMAYHLFFLGLLWATSKLLMSTRATFYQSGSLEILVLPSTSPPLSPLSPPRSSASGKVLVTRLPFLENSQTCMQNMKYWNEFCEEFELLDHAFSINLRRCLEIWWSLLARKQLAAVYFSCIWREVKRRRWAREIQVSHLRVLACLSCHTSKLNCYWYCFGFTYSNKNCFPLYCFSGNSKWIAERRGRNTYRNTVFAPWSTRPTETWTSRGEISHSSGALK